MKIFLKKYLILPIASSFLCLAIAEDINGTSATAKATFIDNGTANNMSTFPESIPYFSLAVIKSYPYF